jgi:RNA polymerase sigma-70 factor, ECF subfamily
MSPVDDASEHRSDRDLVLAFQQGDRRAYAELYRRHMPRVRAVCSRLLGNPQDIEEAAQETFLRSFTALGRFNGEYQVGSWLTRIASNVSVDHLRRSARRATSVELTEEAEELRDDSDPGRVVGDRIELAGALQRIQPLHAKVLVLRTIKGLSHREIGRELEMSAPQVKALLHRARSSFKRVWSRAS